jgi:hypothetical protein
MVGQDPLTEITGLTSRSGALRQAATLPGADLGSLLDAALAELDAAIDALKAAADACCTRCSSRPRCRCSCWPGTARCGG